MPMPCESWPVRLASIRLPVTAATSSGELPKPRTTWAMAVCRRGKAIRCMSLMAGLRVGIDQPVGWRRRSAAQCHGQAALHAGPRLQGLPPALHLRKVGQIDLMARVPPHPAGDGEIGDRQFVGEVLRSEE